MTAILLTLTPEFGGTAFGPFPVGNVALGSDPNQCHIALAAGLGLDPVHAWLTLTDDGSCWLQPTRVGTGLFLFRGTGGGAQPISGAVQLRPGDSFALGPASGPRFVVQPVPDQPGAGKTAGGGRQSPRGGRGMPTGEAMTREVQRQLSTRAMTVGPVAQLSQLFYRARSGALTQPRYLVGGAIALVGMLATGCAGLFAALQQMM